MSAYGAGQIISLSAWCGLFAGLGEIICLGAQKWGFHKALFLGPHTIWMAPLATISIFILIGLFLIALARWRPRFGSPKFICGVLFFFAFLGWLLIFPRLQPHASLLLAAGLGVQGARLAIRRPRFLARLSTARLRWAMAILLALTLGVYGWKGFQENRARAALSPADAPNVLLIVLDTVRAESLSLYGYPRPTTPYLAAVARGGVRFERAISTAPWTIPSHASIFTGRYPHELTADWDRPLDGTHPTLAEGMRERGYATGGFVANTVACGYESGLSRGFMHYEDYTATPAEFLISASLPRFLAHRDLLRRMIGGEDIPARKDAAEINRDFLAWQSRQGEKPFFAFLNYFDAHEPYLPPPPYQTRFGSVAASDPYRVTHRLRLAFRNDREKISTADNQAELNAYDGSIAYLDAQLGALFEELQRRGALEKTIVIVTADHGEAFGEHGHYTHGDSLYLTLLQVPLVISFPGHIPAGTSIPRPVSLRDIPATIAELAGFGGQLHFPGRSLARFWNGAAAVEPSLLSEVNLAPILPRKFPPGSRAIMKSLISDRYHYIRNYDNGEELYDIFKDPLEMENIAGAEESRPALECFRQNISLDRSPTNVD